MSRSFKKAIIKQCHRNYKKSTKYWRVIRRCQKQAVNSSKDVPDPKSIVNDYDYSDYTINYEFGRSRINFWLKNREIEENKYERKARRK